MGRPFLGERERATLKSAALFDVAGVSNESDEWYTPSWIFQALSTEFDLDPCSPGVPPSNVPARAHLTKLENGLTAPWSGSVWLNPPFSSKDQWFERMRQHANGIALMPSRTDSKWLQSCVANAHGLLFLRGRLYFERPSDKMRGHGPPFGILFVAYGERMAQILEKSRLIGLRARVVSSSVSEDDAHRVHDATHGPT